MRTTISEDQGRQYGKALAEITRTNPAFDQKTVLDNIEKKIDTAQRRGLIVSAALVSLISFLLFSYDNLTFRASVLGLEKQISLPISFVTLSMSVAFAALVMINGQVAKEKFGLYYYLCFTNVPPHNAAMLAWEAPKVSFQPGVGPLLVLITPLLLSLFIPLSLIFAACFILYNAYVLMHAPFLSMSNLAAALSAAIVILSVGAHISFQIIKLNFDE
jgi:hypothetical protein